MWALRAHPEAGPRGSGQRPVVEINPSDALAYQNRAAAYYYLKDFDKAWEDVHKAQELGAEIAAGFLKNLQEASRRER